ncbi:hypothetical protein BC827DRAFT_341880 [Russula dissimulans]|nr:hypothetical protein BC827DRAFT_341880 [Russula dissimulans]
MAQQGQKTFEERPRGEEQEEDSVYYKTYLFWPSRGRSSLPLYGVRLLPFSALEMAINVFTQQPIISLYSESEYDLSSSSRPSSPITFAPIVNCTSPPPMEESIDVGVAPLDEPEAEAQEPKEEALAKYSTLFKMGLFFSQVTHHLDRAIEGVKIKLQKPKSQT